MYEDTEVYFFCYGSKFFTFLQNTIRKQSKIGTFLFPLILTTWTAAVRSLEPWLIAGTAPVVVVQTDTNGFIFDNHRALLIVGNLVTLLTTAAMVFRSWSDLLEKRVRNDRNLSLILFICEKLWPGLAKSCRMALSAAKLGWMNNCPKNSVILKYRSTFMVRIDYRKYNWHYPSKIKKECQIKFLKNVRDVIQECIRFIWNDQSKL